MPKLGLVANEGQFVTSNDKTSDRQWQVLQWAISELEKREKLKNRVDIRQNPNKPLQDKIVKLIGVYK